MGKKLNIIQSSLASIGVTAGAIGAALNTDWGWPLLAIGGIYIIEAALFALRK